MPNHLKTYHTFDTQAWETGELLSVKFPEGLQISDFRQGHSTTLVPAWPEEYESRMLGGIRFLAVGCDLPLLDQIDERLIIELMNSIRVTFGAAAVDVPVVIIPPNLESYLKLHAGDRPEHLNWYPAGFQGRGIVVLWPLSVPVYASVEGQRRVMESEIYDTPIHELVHLAINGLTSVFNPVPVWLHEGLAVFLECEYSEFTRSYWDVVAEGYRVMERSLDWDAVTVQSTSSFPIAEARLHYAQSHGAGRRVSRSRWWINLGRASLQPGSPCKPVCQVA